MSLRRVFPKKLSGLPVLIVNISRAYNKRMRYLLRCHFFDALRATLMNNLKNIDSDLPTLRDENIIKILS